MATMPAKIRVTGPNCMHKLPTNMLKLLSPLFANLDDAMLEGKSMYRIKNDRKDMKGQDVSGFFVVQGIIQALSPTKTVVVTTETAPSLALVDNGKGKSVKVLNLADLVNIFELHWEAERATDNAVVSMPTGSAVANAESSVMNKYGIKKVPAMVLNTLIGSGKIDTSLLQGSLLRQIEGGFVAVDAVAVVLFNGNLTSARQWMVNNHDGILSVALSLAHKATGHSSVSICQNYCGVVSICHVSICQNYCVVVGICQNYCVVVGICQNYCVVVGICQNYCVVVGICQNYCVVVGICQNYCGVVGICQNYCGVVGICQNYCGVVGICQNYCGVVSICECQNYCGVV